MPCKGVKSGVKNQVKKKGRKSAKKLLVKDGKRDKEK